MERPPAPRWWRLFGGPGSVLPFRGAHRRRRDWRPCPSPLSDRATAGHALAAAAQDPLGCPRPLRGAPVAISWRARRVLLYRPDPAARALARSRSVLAA